MPKIRRTLALGATPALMGLVGALLFSGCAGPGRTQETQLEWQPDMYVQPDLHAFGSDPMNPAYTANMMPPAGTVPVNYNPFPQAADITGMDQLQNPLPVTAEVLATGRKLFNTYCIVCHGARADGLGYIVPKMTQPPPLIAKPATGGNPLEFSDGRIFSIITGGQGNMPSYQTELDPAQRWAIVHYVRVLQRAANPTAADLARAQQAGMDFSGDYPMAQSATGKIPGTEAIPHDQAGQGH